MADLLNLMIMKGFSKLIIVESWKGNPGNIIFYDMYKGILRPVLATRIYGSTLQVDLKRSVSVSELSIEYDNESRDIGEYLNEYLELPLIDPRRNGVKAVLEIVKRGDYYTMSFRKLGGGYIYPKFKVKKWIIYGE